MSHKCSSCFGTRSKTNQNNHYQTSLVLRLPFNHSFIENRYNKFIFLLFWQNALQVARFSNRMNLDFCAMMATVADSKSTSRTSN